MKTILQQIQEVVPNYIAEMNIVCIGTDRSTGDSLGPLVGMMLQQRGVPNVYGTLHDPVHAVRLENGFLDTLPERYTLAVDACLGTSSRVGTIACKAEPLKPGAGVDKDLPKVGDAHVYGVVNVSAGMGVKMDCLILQNTQLSRVWDMATEIADTVEAFVSSLKPFELEVV